MLKSFIKFVGVNYTYFKSYGATLTRNVGKFHTSIFLGVRKQQKEAQYSSSLSSIKYSSELEAVYLLKNGELVMRRKPSIPAEFRIIEKYVKSMVFLNV